MTLPEAEAFGIKWCPFARVMYADKGSAAAGNRNGIDLNPDAARCIGSSCMAWLWIDPSSGAAPSQQPTGDPVRRGCCGMANSTRTSEL